RAAAREAFDSVGAVRHKAGGGDGRTAAAHAAAGTTATAAATAADDDDDDAKITHAADDDGDDGGRLDGDEPIASARRRAPALWVDKYSPRSFADLLSSDSVNRSCLKWLKLWDARVFGTSSSVSSSGNGASGGRSAALGGLAVGGKRGTGVYFGGSGQR